MRGHPAFQLTLRADAIEKRCKSTAFYGLYQIIWHKNDKFPQNAESSLQNITNRVRLVTFC